MFLVQKLPRVEEDLVEEALGGKALLNRSIQNALAGWSQEVSPFSEKKGFFEGGFQFFL